MATISDERLAEIVRAAENGISMEPGIMGMLSGHIVIPPDDLRSIAAELQSLRSQAGVSEAVLEQDWRVTVCSDKDMAWGEAVDFRSVPKGEYRLAPLNDVRTAPIEITEENDK